MCCISAHSLAQGNIFSGGYYYSAYICEDNNLYTWGSNYYQQMCRDQTTCSYSKPCVADNIENIILIDAGYGTHSLALTSHKRVISWGQNTYGELGAGLFCNSGTPQLCERVTPDTVVGGETGTTYVTQVKKITCGQYQSYALLESGKVVAWGNNTYGQLGIGTNINKSEPVYVTLKDGTHLDNISMIAAGLNHIYALTKTGNVYAWGNNNNYQLACGKQNSQAHPQLVIDKNETPVSNITKISAGASFGLLLRSDGFVYGLGAFKGSHRNTENDNIYLLKNHATLISGGETSTYFLENCIDISAGYSHSLAIIEEYGEQLVLSWGDNKFPSLTSNRGGQLGIGNPDISQSLTPKYVSESYTNLIKNPTYIDAGSGVSYIKGNTSPEEKSYFYVAGTNAQNKLGTNDVFDQYYATNIHESLCSSMCPNISLGNDTDFCSPFEEILHSGLSKKNYAFNWYKNDTLIQNQENDSLTIHSPGTYSVYISDKNEICADQKSSVTIGTKDKNIHIIHNSFCNKKLHFKVIGDGYFRWFNTRNGYSIGTGNTIEVSKYFTEEISTDSIYRVWLQHDDCQKIPIEITKNCNCTDSPPLAQDTSACLNRDFFVRATGDSVIWYDNRDTYSPLAIGNIYAPTHLQEGTHTLYATSITNRCESSADSMVIDVSNCTSWAEISGTVATQASIVPYSLVYLYSESHNTFVDSCVSNQHGKFTLFIDQPDSIAILATSPISHYANTWMGNKTDQNFAHNIYADSYIGGIEIILQNRAQANYAQTSNPKKIKRVEVISIRGIITYTGLTIAECIQKNPQKLQYIRIIYNDNTYEFRTLIPNPN
ncbi:MAG: hypothetical protein R6U95_08045 [Bacteroidales bacterium]